MLSRPGAIRIRNGRGEPIPCCWDDCRLAADDRHRVQVPHDAPRFPGEKLIYTFCGPGHKDLYLHALKGHRGTVPIGSKGLLGPTGLPL